MADPARAPSAPSSPPSSPRRDELLERAYSYALDHSLADLSLRPLAAAIGSSPRVLLFLFGSKDGLIRALLARARADELALLGRGRAEDGRGLAATARATWAWLSAEPLRPLLALWAQAYSRSLVEPDGPWAEFARQTVEDWLAVLAGAQPAGSRASAAGLTQRTLVLAVLRGALLDVLATGDTGRVTAAVDRFLDCDLDSDLDSDLDVDLDLDLDAGSGLAASALPGSPAAQLAAAAPDSDSSARAAPS